MGWFKESCPRMFIVFCDELIQRVSHSLLLFVLNVDIQAMASSSEPAIASSSEPAIASHSAVCNSLSTLVSWVLSIVFSYTGCNMTWLLAQPNNQDFVSARCRTAATAHITITSTNCGTLRLITRCTWPSTRPRLQRPPSQLKSGCFTSTIHRMDTNGASICVTPVHRRSSGLRCSSQVPWTTKSGTRSPTRLETKMCGHDEHVQCFVKRMCFVERFKGEHVQCIAQNLTKTVMVHSEWKIWWEWLRISKTCQRRLLQYNSRIYNTRVLENTVSAVAWNNFWPPGATNWHWPFAAT